MAASCRFAVSVIADDRSYPHPLFVAVVDGVESATQLLLPRWRTGVAVALPLVVGVAAAGCSGVPSFPRWSFAVGLTAGGVELPDCAGLFITVADEGPASVFTIEPAPWAAQTILRSPVVLTLRYLPGDLLNR